jgi:hypothetical protein
VYETGKLTKFYTDVFFEEVVKVDSKKIPIDNTTSKFAGTVEATLICGTGILWRLTQVAEFTPCFALNLVM